ncbi:MAG: GH92 family glycosyl hydrolase [Prevotella sp.]|jgi:predicted alpha-1,2-mannosidase|nr:GH92 family glycosyl hydrolase [Prevotella sp.]
MNTFSKLTFSVLFLLINIISTQAQKPVDYVDMFIGTSNSRWMLGPYAQEPFGMIQLGPDNQGNVWMGGYEYAINSISGFSHIHAWTMGGLMLMPTTADLALGNPSVDSPYKGANAGYHSRIMKDTEVASPGYYSVFLYDHEVKVELSATTRCGIHRYTFPKRKESRVLVDLLFPTEWDYGFKVKDAKITKVSNTELEGYADCQSGSWSSWNEYKLHFVIRFSKPFQALNGWNEGREYDDIETIEGKNDIGVYALYTTEKDEEITVSTAISLVSVEQARLNMDAELAPLDYNFDTVKTQTRDKWNAILSKIKVEGKNEQDKKKFYTNLYRAYAGKQTWNDVNGKYMDACENVQQLESGNMYGGDAFWNTYWNLNGLWSMITPDIVDDWVTTQLEMFKHTGWTSKGPAGLEYSGIMEGSHEMALMVGAYQKGIRKDGEAIYEAILKNVAEPGINHPCGGNCGNPQLDTYIEYGYMPMERGVVSKTLDYAFDDWTVGQMALVLGKKKDAKKFIDRSMNYKNAFHPVAKYVTRRSEDGNWDPNFDVFSNQGFIEGNSWQYSWYVPHDIPGLVQFLGKDLFNSRLEEGFEKSEEHKFAAHVFDRTMGQSAEFYINHGNEVNMCTPFLFNYSGKPWLTQKWTRAILNSFYGDTPYHGWEGDEDEGQMSAWYVMGAMGMFEMTGGVDANSKVELASPIFDKITIELDQSYYKGKTFVIEAHNNYKENIYVQSVTLNGKKLKEPRILFSEIVKGGHLLFEMGSTPNKELFK